MITLVPRLSSACAGVLRYALRNGGRSCCGVKRCCGINGDWVHSALMMDVTPVVLSLRSFRTIFVRFPDGVVHGRAGG
jgi:hypothetical protein